MPLSRIAWFSPLPPASSGIAAYSAELLPLLEPDFEIDCYAGDAAEGPVRSRSAHEFVWRHRRDPYDLTVFQLGNAAWHDYMWAYLANYPGLAVLHDARLHHARARQLLSAHRRDEYRREFRYDHPGAPAELTEYAVEGLGGPIYYLWRMIALVGRTARGVAVHNARVAADLGAELPGTRIDTIRMGVPGIAVDQHVAAALRRQLGIRPDAVVFLAFGKVTAEKRIASSLAALAAVAREHPSVHLLLVGDTSGYDGLQQEIDRSGVADRVSVVGPVADVDGYVAAADACICLRWPTAEETSASWLRCLAAGRATIVSDLPHLSDVPTLLARTWRPSNAAQPPVAVSVDLIEEAMSLRAAMGRLAGDAALRHRIGAAGRAYWNAHHRLELMADDYRALIRDVAARPVPAVADLPPHFTDDYSSRARDLAAQFGVDVDILRRS